MVRRVDLAPVCAHNCLSRNHTTMRTFSPACDLQSRQLVWALLKNGSPVLQQGQPGILTAVEIAGFYFRKYGQPLKPLAV